MAGYEPSTYGERWAETYDAWAAGLGALADPEVVAGKLAELAGEGPALELAIGTGRIALPLAARGVEVHGIDASEAMVAKLKQKPAGDAIPVTIGDMADVAVDGRFRLVYLVFNTFFALLTQEDQVRCFANVAGHLAENGVFVLEAFVPDMTRFQQGQHVSALDVQTDAVTFDAAQHDQATQRINSMHVTLEDGRVQMLPVQIRYAWPSELDLMARLVGLRLRDRWSDWSGEPFTSASGKHISVYARLE